MTTVSYPILLTKVSDIEDYIKSEFPQFTLKYVIYNTYKSKKIASTIDVCFDETLTESEISDIKDSLGLYVYPYKPTTTDIINYSSDNYRYSTMVTGRYFEFSTTFVDVPFYLKERLDDSFAFSNNELTLTNTGQYLINIRMACLQRTKFFSDMISQANSSHSNSYESQAVFKVLVDSGGGYSDLPGTYSYLHITPNIDDDFNEGLLTFIYNGTVNDKLKIQVKNESSDNDILLDTYNLFNITKISYTDSISKFISLYDTTLQTLTNSYSDISFDTQRFIDTDNYTHSSSTITFLSDSTYLIMISINTRNYGTTEHNQATFKLQLDTGGGFNDIEGSYCYNYNMYADSIKGGNFANIILTSNFNNGDILKIQGKDSQNDNIKVENINFNILKFNTYLNTFSGYNNSTISLNKIFKDIPINTERIKDSYYTHDTDSSIVKINKKGTYFLISTINNYSTNNTRAQGEARLLYKQHDQTDFKEILSSITANYVSKSSEGSYNTNTTFTVLFLHKDDQLKMQYISTKSSGKKIEAKGASLCLFTLENYIEPINPNINKFGSYFAEHRCTTWYLNTTKFLPILYLNTKNIPTGTYRVGFSFGFQVHNNSDMCTLNVDINHVTYKEIKFRNPNKNFSAELSPRITSFFYVDLTCGFYFIQLLIENENDRDFIIHNPQIEFWQVK